MKWPLAKGVAELEFWLFYAGGMIFFGLSSAFLGSRQFDYVEWSFKKVSRIEVAFWGIIGALGGLFVTFFVSLAMQ